MQAINLLTKKLKSILDFFITVGDNGCVTSYDSKKHELKTTQYNNYIRAINSVCWSPELNLFCAVTNSGTGNRVMTSPDGINWTGRASANDTFWWYSVCWSSKLNLFCAVAYSGTGNRVMTSPDGINWTSISAANNTYQYRSISWHSKLELFCACGTNNNISISENGIDWIEIENSNGAGSYSYLSICAKS